MIMNTAQELRTEFESKALQDPVVIVGYGISGIAFAKYCERLKIKYFIWDDRVRTASDQHTQNFFGGFLSNEEELTHQHLSYVLVSPGIKKNHPVLEYAQSQGINAYGDLEIASWYLPHNLIGITGTNGKSTTTKLVAELLSEAGYKTIACGNYGQSLLDFTHESPYDYYIVEESSYQLEWVVTLRHKCAIWLNLTDDHLERYGTLEEYGKAKSCIFKNMKKDDVIIYNDDDPHVRQYCKGLSLVKCPYSLVRENENGGFATQAELILKCEGQIYRFDNQTSALKGWHNQENMLASLLCVLNLDRSPQALLSYAQVLQNFHSLDHRLQKFLTHKGINYYDDSKATNVGAVAMALASFEGSLILLMGGVDKGGSYTPLEGLITAKVKNLVTFGQAGLLIQQALQSKCVTQYFPTLKEATEYACRIACEGDVVLLSPACSSFDEFKDYKHRGDSFQNWVKSIVQS